MQQPALSRNTVDRCSDSRRDPDWLRGAWGAGGRLLRLDAALTAGVSGEQPSLVWEPTPKGEPPGEAVLLGADEAGAYWALDTPEVTGPGGSRRVGLREIGQLLTARDSGLLTHAVAVITWHRNHTHCPRCGAPTVSAQAGAVRLCTRDGSEHFPRVDPAMIVLVRSPDGSRAVLGRAPSWPDGFFSCLAGFVEPGESAEQSVIREVAEEVGLAAHTVRYAGSQPWPFPSSLMLAFTAVADVGALSPQPSELADAGWFSRSDVSDGLAAGRLGLPPEVSIARGLIDDWLTS